MARREWWQRARLRRDEDENRERKVGWLELFYDLVFVVVISQVSHALSEHVTWGGLGTYVLLFAPVWWVWIGGTIYAERFETEDVAHRLFTFLQMLPVAGMAAFAHHGTGETSTGFALSYVAARAILIVLWLRGGLHDRAALPTVARFASGFTIAVVLWVTSIWIPAPWKFALWAVAVLIDAATPLSTVRVQRLMPKLSTSHLPERFGLFTLIVMGESVLGVVNGLASAHHPTVDVFVAAVLGMALAFGYWWLYFDMIWRKPPHPTIGGSMARSYLHLPLCLAITATGAAVVHMVGLGGEPLPDPIRWLACGAVACTMVVLAVFQSALQQPPGERGLVRLIVILLLAGGAAAVLTGFLADGQSPVVVLGTLLGLLLVPIVTGTVWWFQQEDQPGHGHGGHGHGH